MTPTAPFMEPRMADTAYDTFASDDLVLRFGLNLDLVRGVLDVAEEWGARMGAHKDARASLRLVLEELLVNLCMHGGALPAASEEGGAALRLSALFSRPDGTALPGQEAKGTLSRIRITLEDQGPPFNPLVYRERSRRRDQPAESMQNAQVGGRGLILVSLLAADIEYRRVAGYNQLTLTIMVHPPGTETPAHSPFSDAPLDGFRAVRAERGLLTALRFLWRSSLAVRQTVVFFILSAAVLWSGFFITHTGVRALRAGNVADITAHSQRVQDATSVTFLRQVAGKFKALTDDLEQRADLADLMENDVFFFDEVADSLLARSILGEYPVLGLLKGEKDDVSALFIRQDGEHASGSYERSDVNELARDVNAGDEAVWISPFYEVHDYPVPGERINQHAGMLLIRKLPPVNDREYWLGVAMGMPWIADTLVDLAGFSHAIPAFLTADGRYIIYPPGRGVEEGPQSLAEEGAEGKAAEFSALAAAVAAGESGTMALETLFSDEFPPWPVPWEGPTTLVYSPMSMPEWRFLLLVSSEEIGAVQPPVSIPMLLLAAFGPFFMALLAWVVNSGTVTPLRKLASSLERMGEGDLDTPIIAPETPDAPGMPGGAGGAGDTGEVNAMLRAFEMVRITLKGAFAATAERTRAEQRVSNELSLARGIQLSMLPASLPTLPGIDVAASMDMAGEVCGDLYDCFTLPGDDDNMYCLIGDVCGKGIPASIIMSRVMVLARSSLLQGLGPAAVLEALNASLLRHNNSMMFVTLTVLFLNRKTGVLTYASAGHPPPIAGKFAGDNATTAQGILPWTRELVLGVKEGISYTDHSFTLAPDQAVLLYTDGADEAMGPVNAADGQIGSTEGRSIFGEESLEAAFNAACAPAGEDAAAPRSEAVLAMVRAAIADHMAGAEPVDDVSLLVMRWTGPVTE
ncbi:SpoIIE family protein phosphatase [Desulfovibrio sp. OttesenSCG-928-I05]|nr:SpoIIE family protein phosphatase [Desulfovibrio sp. OttesenSCG-928-I05]